VLLIFAAGNVSPLRDNPVTELRSNDRASALLGFDHSFDLIGNVFHSLRISELSWIECVQSQSRGG
jgi:hypothetical protein